MSEHSQFLRVGFGFLFWRPKLTNRKPTLASRYTGGTAPNPLLKDVVWTTTGMFLGPTEDIDLKPSFEEKTERADGNTSDTSSILEGQAYDVGTVLQYNAVQPIISFGLLPASQKNGFERTDGGNINPDEGTLVIVLTNNANSVGTYHHIIQVLVLQRMKVLPGGFVIKGGHVGIRVSFKSMAARDEVKANCYQRKNNLSHFYTTSIYNPTVPLMSDGQPINTDPDHPLFINDVVYLNID